jgi:excisionase family DNA binding protein
MDEPIVIVTEHTRQHLSTVQEFADLLRVHPKTIYRLIRADKLKGVVRLDNTIRINANEALGRLSASAYVERVP